MNGAQGNLMFDVAPDVKVITGTEQESEEWRPLKDSSAYVVSNLGRIKRTILGKGTKKNHKEMKSHLSKWGYYQITVSIMGKHVSKTLHIAVLESFISSRPEGCVGNHKNGIKTDCRLSNLEWIPKKEDILHSYKTGLHKPNRRLSDSDIKEIRDLLRERSLSQTAIAKKYGVGRYTIVDIKRGWIARNVF